MGNLMGYCVYQNQIASTYSSLYVFFFLSLQLTNIKNLHLQTWFNISLMAMAHCLISSYLNPLTLEVVGAPQMTLQQYLSILPCLPLPSESPNPIPIHSLMLSSHLFFCLPLLLAPFTVPCRIVFAMPEDLEMWSFHLSFHFFTMVRRSSCTPIAFWILLRTSSFVTWSLYQMFRSLL